jgi:hypothetical protein
MDGDPEPVVTPLPVGIGGGAPGPELFGLLSEVDRAACNGYQLVQVMAARARLVSWLQAQLLLDAAELAHAGGKGPAAPPTRMAGTDPHTADEIACALGWSVYAAEELLGTGAYLAKYAPALFAALVAGEVDLAKVKVILTELEPLDRDKAAAAIDALLPGIAGRTREAIRDQARRLALSVDGEAAAARYDRAVARRQVSLRAQPDGTALLTGRFLPADKASAAFDYLTRMATATKRAGDPDAAGRDRRRVDQVRADVFLDLLAGADPTVAAAQGGAGAVAPAARAGTVSVAIDAATLFCLNDHAADLAGFGPIAAEVARRVIDEQAANLVWRMRITHDGQLISEHRLHRRPTAEQLAYVRARDPVCRFPTCRRPAHQCQIDHVRDWADGGITHEDNLQTACARHNLAKSPDNEGHWTADRIDGGVLWTSPRGHAYPTMFHGRELDQGQRRLIQHLVNAGETKRPYNPRE